MQLERSVGLLRFRLFLYDVTSSATASDFIHEFHTHAYTLLLYLYIFTLLYVNMYIYVNAYIHTHIYIYFTNIELLGVLFIFLWGSIISFHIQH